MTLAATSKGKRWTVSGFNSTFIKFIAGLERAGTLLIEAGFDIDSVRRWLGQRTLGMAIHDTKTADTSEKLRAMTACFDPLGTKC